MSTKRAARGCSRSSAWVLTQQRSGRPSQLLPALVTHSLTPSPPRPPPTHPPTPGRHAPLPGLGHVRLHMALFLQLTRAGGGWVGGWRLAGVATASKRPTRPPPKPARPSSVAGDAAGCIDGGGQLYVLVRRRREKRGGGGGLEREANAAVVLRGGSEGRRWSPHAEYPRPPRVAPRPAGGLQTASTAQRRSARARRDNARQGAPRTRRAIHSLPRASRWNSLCVGVCVVCVSECNPRTTPQPPE